MEYQKSGDTSWKSISGTTVTGLANGTYYVRKKAVAATSFKSANATVTIEPYTTTEPEKNIYKFGRDTYGFQNFGDSDSPGGHCFGMSVTSSGYYLGLLDISITGGNNNQGLYALSANSTVKAPICYYQPRQGSPALKATVAGGSTYKTGVSNITSDWTEVVNYVKSHAYDDKGGLQIGFRKNSQGGHAINFLRYSEVDGQPRIYAYDNNFPKSETYFYKDNQGLIRQAPNSTFSGAIDCIALRNVATYFSIAGGFNLTHVIYADKDTISVENAVVYPMDGNIELGEHVMFEIPEQMEQVVIIPLTDGAAFKYLDNTYSFGKIDDDTIGILTLSTLEENALAQDPVFTVIQNSEQTYTVTVKAGVGGTVSGGGKFAKNTEVTITATPNTGFAFDGWYDNSVRYETGLKITGAGAVYTFTVTGDCMLEARFTANEPNPGSISNFAKTKTYKSGMFTDVDENQWYGFKQGKVIASAYEYGLMQGNSANTFNPTGNITIAEAITVASRVHSIYMTGKENFTAGNPWYQPYVDYAVANGIISSGDFTNYTRSATRAEMAYIFSRSLPTAEFAAQNTVNSLPDVNTGTKYYDAILSLYKAGVVGGNDAAGTFKPNANITRAEAAAIISRVVLPTTRLSGKTY